MLRDNLAGLIEPIMGSAGTVLLALLPVASNQQKISDDRPPMP